MKPLSVAEQVASHLREELSQGRWTGVMPGRDKLAREFGVHGSTVERALRQLEREGLLMSAGVGKPRRVTAEQTKPRSTRLVAVLYEPEDILDPLVIELQSQLVDAGHKLTFAPKALTELKHEPQRVMKMMEGCPAEGWIVIAGSKPLLEKFSEAATPTFALFGRKTDLPIAGTGADKLSAMGDCVRYLKGKGCRRIVMLTRAEQIQPVMGAAERVFLDELAKSDLPSGAYNLPNWENTPEGLHQCLASLFQLTAPDAILVDDWMLSFGIQNYLSRQEGPAFRKARCVSMDYHPSFKWCRPEIAHFAWDSAAVVRKVVKWADNVAKGKEEKKWRLVKARFVPGG